MRAKHPTCLGLAPSSTTETESERGLGCHAAPMQCMGMAIVALQCHYQCQPEWQYQWQAQCQPNGNANGTATGIRPGGDLLVL